MPGLVLLPLLTVLVPKAAVADLCVAQVGDAAAAGSIEAEQPIRSPVLSPWIVAVAEMPPSGIAALVAHEGVFALGPKGGLAPAPGGEAAWSRVAKHVFRPSRSELLFMGHKGFFPFVDRRLPGSDACARPPP